MHKSNVLGFPSSLYRLYEMKENDKFMTIENKKNKTSRRRILVFLIAPLEWVMMENGAKPQMRDK